MRLFAWLNVNAMHPSPQKLAWSSLLARHGARLPYDFDIFTHTRMPPWPHLLSLCLPSFLFPTPPTQLLWPGLLARHGARLPYDFDISTLAHLSEGYTSGCIDAVASSMLSEARLARLRAGGAKEGVTIPEVLQWLSRVGLVGFGRGGRGGGGTGDWKGGRHWGGEVGRWGGPAGCAREGVAVPEVLQWLSRAGGRGRGYYAGAFCSEGCAGQGSGDCQGGGRHP